MAYLFNTPEDQQEMLRAIGAGSIEELFAGVPKELRLARPLTIPDPMAEAELTLHMSALARRNQGCGELVCFLGGGAYDHFIPATVDALAGRGEFFTSYTPYQPEVSQGNLQVMFEYETMICQLSGMDVSNASLYDGASACVEAVLLALSISPSRRQVIVCESLHPEYRQALVTYLQFLDAQLITLPAKAGCLELESLRTSLKNNSVACVVLSQPNFFGVVEDLAPAAALAKEAGSVVIAVADMLSLGLLQSPGQWGADVVVGEGQPLGIPLQFGGPYLGIMACREALVRRMPGRIAGQTIDRSGQRCWVLTLQTREQHIRRDKATSNICTNQGLLALRATIYLSLLGPQGLQDTAAQCAWKTAYLSEALASSDRWEVAFPGSNWREIVLRDNSGDVESAVQHAQLHGLLAGLPLGQWYPHLSDCLLVAVTEKRSRSEIDKLVDVLTHAPSLLESTRA